MSKFNTRDNRRVSATSPITTEPHPSGTTFEGGAGYARDAKSELFLLAVTNMVGENTFYENADERDDRFDGLVRQVTRDDPAWMLHFVTWLRGEANMRSASIVAAVEAVKERTEHYAAVEHAATTGESVRSIRMSTPGEQLPVSYSRAIIDAALQRADEPGELLACWMSRYGRRIPKPVKRGIGDAVGRLYTQRALLKYDTASHGFRFGDVLDLVHPTPAADKPWQGALFAHALDRRHGRAGDIEAEALPMVAHNGWLRNAAVEDPALLLDSDGLARAGMTWEDALSLGGPKLDKAKLWAALIPSMGYMALLRNLRNFDEASVPDAVAQQVAARLADPDEVARSRQLPMRFLSAYRAAPSLRWSYPLEQALGHCLANVPTLTGRTLILVDTSSSMDAGFSKDGTLKRWDAAVVFGVALAQRCATADVVSFSSTAYYIGQPHGAHTKVFPLVAGESLLRSIARWKDGGWFLGGGTATAAALRQHFTDHDRVVIVTDEQAAHDGGEVSASMPASVPLYTWNLAGYRMGHAPSGTGMRHTFGGLTDQAFRMIPLLEAGRSAAWPWVH